MVAFVTVSMLVVLFQVKPAEPPESAAGVAAVEVQNGTRVAVSADDVATAPAPPAPVASVPHDRTPEVEDFTSQFAALRPETTRFVDEAVPLTVIAVEDAYGNWDAATVEDEKKTPPDQMEVEVAFVVVPKLVCVVNGNA